MKHETGGNEPRGLAALAAQVEHYRLVFRWPERTASLLLPGLFVLSVAAHAVAFYIFQVQYPPSVASAPPPAQVALLTADTPQGAALLKWVEARDPATAARLQTVAPPGLGEVSYIPSYAAAQTLPLEQEMPSAPDRFPAANNLLDLIEAPAPTPEAVSRRVASTLAFSESIRSRDKEPGTPLPLTAKSSANLRPTVFLVGISDRGEASYCFLQERSTDPAMDAQAEALLRQHAFHHSGVPLEWGYATFNWGAEAYAPAPSQPAPPATAAAPGT